MGQHIQGGRMIHVGHVYKAASHKGKLIYVGRASSADRITANMLNLSVLGNPEEMKLQTEGERNRVCNVYKEYMLVQFINNKRFAAAINQIQALHEQHGEITLLCWCWPKRCHAHEIAGFVQRITI